MHSGTAFRHLPLAQPKRLWLATTTRCEADKWIQVKDTEKNLSRGMGRPATTLSHCQTVQRNPAIFITFLGADFCWLNASFGFRFVWASDKFTKVGRFGRLGSTSPIVYHLLISFGKLLPYCEVFFHHVARLPAKKIRWFGKEYFVIKWDKHVNNE